MFLGYPSFASSFSLPRDFPGVSWCFSAEKVFPLWLSLVKTWLCFPKRLPIAFLLRLQLLSKSESTKTADHRRFLSAKQATWAARAVPWTWPSNIWSSTTFAQRQGIVAFFFKERLQESGRKRLLFWDQKAFFEGFGAFLWGFRWFADLGDV